MSASSSGQGRSRALLAVIALLALLGLGTPPTASAANPPVLDVQLSSVRVSGNAPTDRVILEGTVTNNTAETVRSVRLNLWRSGRALTTPAQVASALASASPPPGRLFASNAEHVYRVTPAGGAFAPRASASFVVRGTLRDLGLRAGASYWAGVNVVGTRAGSDVFRDLGRALSLATVPSRRPPTVVSVVELAATPRIVKPGLFLDDSLAAELTGRLTIMLDAAARPGVSWVVDPELYASVTDMADGYRVVSSAGTRAGTGTQAAKDWLRAFDALPRPSGYQSLYARPDLVGAAHAGAGAILARAERARAAVALPLSALVTATRVDRAALDAVTGLRRPVLTTGLGSGRPWSLVGRTRVAGAVPLDTRIEAPALGDGEQAQTAARVAVTTAAGVEVRLLRTADDVAADRRATPGWFDRAGLADLTATRPTPLRLDPDPEPASQAGPVNAATTPRLNALARDLAAYGAAAAASGVTGAVDAQVARGAGEAWLNNRRGQEDYLASMEARVGATALRDGVRLSVAARVTMSSAESEFPVTVSNGLADTIVVRLAARTDNPQRISIAASREATIRPGDSELIPLAVTAASNGVVESQVHVQTLDRRRLTPDAAVTIETSNLGAIGWGIVVVSGIVLVATTALRIRQVRSGNQGSE